MNSPGGVYEGRLVDMELLINPSFMGQVLVGE